MSDKPTLGVPRKARIDSIDAFRGFTILAMIFVIQVAGYRNLPHTFPHFGSAPVSTWKHAENDTNPKEWAFYEGTTTSTLYRLGQVEARATDGTYSVVFPADENRTTATFSNISIPYTRPLKIGASVIASSQSSGTPPADWSNAANLRITGPGNGCTITDLVAPFFVFIVGMCLPLSRNSRGGDWWKHALLRTFGLILAGVIYISLILKLSWWWGILQAIGVAYFLGAISMQMPVFGRYILIAAIAVIHAAMSQYFPWWTHVSEGDPTKKFFTIQNLGGDKLTPLNVHCTPWGSISYGLITIVGTLLGEAVATRDRKKIITQSLLIGLIFSAIGYAAHLFQAPMNKEFVSSSYSLFTAGQGALWFLAFYLVIDVAGFKKWAYPLNVFGANALLAYFLQPIVRIFFEALGLRPFFGNQAAWSGMMWGMIWVTCLWVVVWWCNRRNIYWKL